MNPLLGVFMQAFESVLGSGRFQSVDGQVVFATHGNPRSWLIATIKSTSACNPEPSAQGLAWLLAWALNEMSSGRGPACGVPGCVTELDVGREVLYASPGGHAVEIGKVVDVGVATRVVFVDFGHGGVQQIKACNLENVTLLGGACGKAQCCEIVGDASGE